MCNYNTINNVYFAGCGEALLSNFSMAGVNHLRVIELTTTETELKAMANPAISGRLLFLVSPMKYN